MKILISPAKSIDEKALKSSVSTIPIFQNEAQKIVKNLRNSKVEDLKKLMSISEDLAQLNWKRYKNWKKSTSEDQALITAGFAFSGEVYRGLDLSSLSEKELEIANKDLRILSGLYGILKPSDLIYPYRLEMGTRFSPIEDQKNLYEFWKDKIAKTLKKELEKDEVIINLASNEYFKAVDIQQLKNRIITPVFKEFKNGKFTIVMMYAKHARGSMARYLIQNQLTNIEELKLYNIDGYSFDSNQSNENEWVFVR
ncbi:MAG: peroxide stress protein YaaA [Flavobacteriales bacterium]|nr:peroxide stress protein YaaA [Flavobacteriales bacterium]